MDLLIHFLMPQPIFGFFPLITLAVASLVMSGVGMAMSYSAAKTTAKNQQAAADYNAAVQRQTAEQQAAYAEQQALYQQKTAANQAEQERLERDSAQKSERTAAKQRRARIESSYAAAGVTLAGTSAENALAEQATTDEFNILENNRISKTKQKYLLAGGDLAQWEGSTQAAMTRWAGNSSANLSLFEGLASAQATKMQGNASLISQGSSFLSQSATTYSDIKGLGDSSKFFS